MTTSFRLPNRSSATDLRLLLRPIAPSVSRALGEKAKRHAELAQRYGETQGRVVATRAKLAEVERADDEAARAAIAAGKPLPKPKAPAVVDALARPQGTQRVGRGVLSGDPVPRSN